MTTNREEFIAANRQAVTQRVTQELARAAFGDWVRTCRECRESGLPTPVFEGHSEQAAATAVEAELEKAWQEHLGKIASAPKRALWWSAACLALPWISQKVGEMEGEPDTVLTRLCLVGAVVAFYKAMKWHHVEQPTAI